MQSFYFNQNLIINNISLLPNLIFFIRCLQEYNKYKIHLQFYILAVIL